MAEHPAGEPPRNREKHRLDEDRGQHVAATGAQRPHDRHVAAPLERGPHHAHEDADRRHDDDERRHQEQEQLERPHEEIEQLPDFADRLGSLPVASLVDRLLEAHRHEFRRQAGNRRGRDENGGDLTLGVGQGRWPAACTRRLSHRRRCRRIGHAVRGLRVPLLEEEAFHVHVHAAVDGRVGAGQDARDAKGIVHRAVVGPVRGRERVADREAEASCHLVAEDASEEVVVAEVDAGREAERTPVDGRHPVEGGGVRADHAVAAEVIPHADRHGRLHAGGIAPGHAVRPLRRRQELPVEVPGNVLDRPADEVDAVEHQLERAPLGADDHVVAEAAPARERPLDDARRDERGDDECHAERERE